MSINNTNIIKFDNNNIDEKNIEDDGKRIYHSNEFFRSLANLMEHPEFKNIFKEHFKSWDDIKIFVMFLKVYEKIGDQFPDFNGYQKISLLKTLFDTTKTRHLICAEIIHSFNNIKITKKNYKKRIN